MDESIEVTADMLASKTWQQTANLRIALLPTSEPDTELEQLQQMWICRETGEERWQDVPKVRP